MIWVPKSERRIFRIERIICSQTPPAWLACRGLKFHLIPRLLRQLSIRSGFQCSKAVLISVSAPLKLVPLSLKTSISEPRLLTNLVKAWINESVVRSWAISMCTARIAKHVITHPYLFIIIQKKKPGKLKQNRVLGKRVWVGSQVLTH